MRRLHEVLLAAFLLMGCGELEPAQEAVEVSRRAEALGAGGGREEEPPGSRYTPGERLFRRETFGGNGRTCETCHGMATGTVSPEELQARFAANPEDPMFRSIDSDDGVGNSYTRLLRDATVLVSVPLPPNVRLAADPSATHVVLQRGIPSTLDTPALDPVLMMDGREPDLASQARSAILSHAGAPREPHRRHLEMLASFEQQLFSNPMLRQYASGGPEPVLPEGENESERRGRAFFAPDRQCGACHSGPLLNEVPAGNMFGLRPGMRFARILVSELNPGKRPVQQFILTQPDGTTRLIRTPDPGRFLMTGDINDINTFKIGTLWNVKNTAPYFHDNSAATLEAVMLQYDELFNRLKLPLSPQDKEDIIAYLRKL